MTDRDELRERLDALENRLGVGEKTVLLPGAGGSEDVELPTTDEGTVGHEARDLVQVVFDDPRFCEWCFAHLREVYPEYNESEARVLSVGDTKLTFEAKGHRLREDGTVDAGTAYRRAPAGAVGGGTRGGSAGLAGRAPTTEAACPGCYRRRRDAAPNLRRAVDGRVASADLRGARGAGLWWRREGLLEFDSTIF